MEDILDVATRFLANRMKTRSQLEKHLSSKEYPLEEINELLSRFEEYGYLNDSSYAAIYITHGIQKGRAMWRIKRELLERGVSEIHIETGLKQFMDETEQDPIADEFQRGMAQAEKIIGHQSELDKKLLAKAGRKLMSLGYRSETIYSILGEFIRGKGL
jgi:SOS response regulatory protein OraA/RecX